MDQIRLALIIASTFNDVGVLRIKYLLYKYFPAKKSVWHVEKILIAYNIVNNYVLVNKYIARV